MQIPSMAILLFSIGTSVPLGASGPPAERRPGPPPAAFDACSGKNSGDSCTVTFHDRSITGTCQVAPQSERLLCVPEHAPLGPPRQ
jgi:hypothetical protein